METEGCHPPRPSRVPARPARSLTWCRRSTATRTWVTRIGHAALRHIAVLPPGWTAERLLAVARAQAAANRLDTCLALEPETTIYISADGAEHRAAFVPTGLPVVERLRLPVRLLATPELEARRARLRAYAASQAGPRYFVGDGLEGGRPATSDERVRLRVVDGDPHPGLARCATCNGYAGDYLATRGEGNGDPRPRVIRVHCGCDNHNRCAGCGEPLAESRLSAYHFDETRGSVCYRAAYAAFSHRCPRSDRRSDGS